jgi:hypothetical protein
MNFIRALGILGDCVPLPTVGQDAPQQETDDLLLSSRKRSRKDDNLDFSNEKVDTKTYEIKHCIITVDGVMVKRGSCLSQRYGSGCKAKVHVEISDEGKEIVEIGVHTCVLTITVLQRGGRGRPIDNRPIWQLASYPLGINITRSVKEEIYHMVYLCRRRNRMHYLTGASEDRLYIPDLYSMDIPPYMAELRDYLLALFAPILAELRMRYPHVKYFRIGLLLSEAYAVPQDKVHYDYGPELRKLLPKFRALSCLMSIDGFSFTYLGDNGIWQRIWCPEGTWLNFTDGCLHFGSANPFGRPALRAFFYGVSNEAHFPNNEVYPPSCDFPRPELCTIGCEEDQDPTFPYTEYIKSK